MNTANYILLDAARMDGAIQHARSLNTGHSCLYEGDSEKFLAAVAPWLFAFEPGTPFAQWVVTAGKRNSWGIFFRSEVEPVRLYKHLRRFLIVQTEQGREMYFRYYDPRVLRAFLPTCDTEQLKEFFGPIKAFVAEDENGLLVEYALSKNELRYTELAEPLEGLASEAVPLVRTDQLSETDNALFQEEGRAATSERTAPPEPKPSKGWDFGF